ncbi:hypothetical protein HW555_003752 [Spodoptera exigua]|uniref:Uncharacterized protein n=1 Tax=Spodoptera exigua TaxID=7107 RepID=A0A835L601_SPOEX|nr:hypothetical protein HW555_003752 [Spodoptera exigua]
MIFYLAFSKKELGVRDPAVRNECGETRSIGLVYKIM